MFADSVCGRKKRCSLRTGHYHSDFLLFSRFLRSRMYLARFAFPSSELRWYLSLQEGLQNRWFSFRAKYQSWQKSHSISSSQISISNSDGVQEAIVASPRGANAAFLPTSEATARRLQSDSGKAGLTKQIFRTASYSCS